MPRPAIHPGEILADELAELSISADGLSRILDWPPDQVAQVLAGEQAVTPELALRLGQWLGSSAEMWLNLQKLYELRLAEQS